MDVAALNSDPSKRVAKISPLYRAILHSKKTGVVVNACPFNCADDDLDDHGYCAHLIGFTNDKKVVERLVESPLPGGGRVVSGASRERVRPTDKLMRITTSFRVYRERPDPVGPTVAVPIDVPSNDEDAVEPDEADLSDEEMEKVDRPTGTGVRGITHAGKSLG